MGDPRPIGFFDSGVGGLTVLREVSRRLPGESTVYLGDNARTPYGPRPDDEVVRFSSECLDELTRRDVKALVVACNTSTAVALPHLRRRYGVPILGVVRPGATAATLATRTGGVGVIATPATIRSHAYFAAIKEEDPFVEVYELATPELVPLVEAGLVEGPVVDATVRRSLAPLLAPIDGHGLRGEGDGASGDRTRVPPIDTLLLGCTHYPLIATSIRRVAGEGIAVIDSASATASALASLLEVHGLGSPSGADVRHELFTTGDVERFRATAVRLFGASVADVRPVALADAPAPADERAAAATS
jgi:glutamate racemase